MKKLIFPILICLLACTPALYQPSPEIADKSGHSFEKLHHGRQLYINHCGSCHPLHLPKEFSEKVWRSKIDTMKIKARITDSELVEIKASAAALSMLLADLEAKLTRVPVPAAA